MWTLHRFFFLDVTKKMDTEIRELNAFVNIHAHKVPRSMNRVVHLARQHDNSLALDASFQAYTVDDINREFDRSQTLVQWLLKQISTYNIDKEVVLGIIFQNGTILAHVVKKQ